eukprot:330909-Prorocentrum_minimum.AAC.2
MLERDKSLTKRQLRFTQTARFGIYHVFFYVCAGSKVPILDGGGVGRAGVVSTLTVPLIHCGATAQADVRRLQRKKREEEWASFNKTKPDQNYENPDDVAAIQVR